MQRFSHNCVTPGYNCVACQAQNYCRNNAFDMLDALHLINFEVIFVTALMITVLRRLNTEVATRRRDSFLALFNPRSV